MYLLIILHQTATGTAISSVPSSCIFLSSYIKPQLIPFAFEVLLSCIFLSSYIKPQLFPVRLSRKPCCIFLSSYIKPQLVFVDNFTDNVVSSYHPTSNRNFPRLVLSCKRLYLLIILHQTATSLPLSPASFGCIFLSSYIKPQLSSIFLCTDTVVSSYHPTSNRNFGNFAYLCGKLYLLIILHQTATARLIKIMPKRCIFLSSYIKPQLCDELRV